jgi:hypothetical protein
VEAALEHYAAAGEGEADVEASLGAAGIGRT